MRKKKLIYFEPNDPCCEGEYKSQEQLLKENAIIGTAYLCDEDANISKIWGDDWNDAPKCCNSGSPYKETVKGYEERIIRLGDLI
jgi:hypothetical protein